MHFFKHLVGGINTKSRFLYSSDMVKYLSEKQMNLPQCRDRSSKIWYDGYSAKKPITAKKI